MIAVDTSAMVAYLEGERSADLQPLDDGLEQRLAIDLRNRRRKLQLGGGRLG